MLFLIAMALATGLWWIYQKQVVAPRKVPDVHMRSRHKNRLRDSRNVTEGKQRPDQLFSSVESSVPHRKIAIIIDDIGYNPLSMEELIKIDASLTFSILPHCPYSISSAEDIHRAKREILLHLPMEPLSYPRVNPGKGVLLLRMDSEELLRQLDDDIDAVPYISGVNNHMGSRFMADEKDLTVIMREMRKRNLFFVDSRTTSDTKGEKVASITGLPCLSRNVFIDNVQDYEATLKILLNLSSSGETKPLIVIGHPYGTTIKALKEAVPLLRQSGIEIVPVSHLLSRGTGTS
jgi:polysaccharide deacetylase 2 family uncharacterized protein YibQ